jgi:hypothetical protein
MRKLDAIKQRLAKATDPNTNTDEKLENGGITDFVMYGESDVAWLLERVGELMNAGQRVLIPYDSDTNDLLLAINRTVEAEDESEGK